MPQTSYIVIFLVLGFVVYVTVKGELPAYKQAIFSSSDSSGSTSTTNTSGGSGIGSPAPGQSSTFAG